MKEGKFKDGKLLEWIKTKGKNSLGNVLDIVGELSGKEMIEKIGESLKDDVTINPADREELNRLLELEIEYQEIYLKDVQDARNREIELAKAGKKDPMMIIVGVVGISVFVFMVVAIVYKPELQDNKLLIHLLGMVEGVALTIFAYYYGSSKGSKEKTQLLGKK